MKYLLFTLTIFLLACGASKEVVKTDDMQVKQKKYDESFDPNTLNDDDIVIARHDASKKVQTKIDDQNLEQGEPIFKEVKGFRVQILATKSIEAATLTEQEAKDLFSSMQQKVYLIFDAPLYKIRVGDVTSRDDAEEIRDVAKDYGYREAFIVPSKVNIPQNQPADSF